jgi:ABC-type transport system involved in cytochrome bd biosynthesis fused ATPase/permease subunit
VTREQVALAINKLKKRAAILFVTHSLPPSLQTDAVVISDNESTKMTSI